MKQLSLIPKKHGLKSVGTNRLLSLDTFRGITVAAMILVNNPGDWGHIYAPLGHAKWHGWTPTDLIFPFFLFIVGVSISYALQNKEKTGLVGKIVKRSLILFGLGLFLNLFPKFDFSTVRIPGVLPRIALVYLACSLIYLKTTTRTQSGLIAILLVGYWLLMTFVPVPAFGPANLDPETNLGAWLDRTLLGEHLWKTAKVWDPEGLLSTLPAIATGLSGILAGTLLKSNRSEAEKTAWLFVAGCLSLLGAYIWNGFFPINKSLWTSSFVLLTSGLALQALALCYWLIDVQGYRRWTRPFVAFGVNAITVFFLSGLIPRILNLIRVAQPDGTDIGAKEWLYQTFFVPYFESPYNASLAGALTFVLIWFIILYVMYQKKIIIKV
ncbi:acyltransferase family protein [Larkinella bovis]|uniref:Acyltransferase family protein n=1 Tax=Larkinella bovis TaxID=683041 RepID=A0ABW0IBP2_9BACT